MAHNLNVKDGKVAMAYVGEKPWHGLGTRVEKAMTSAEAIKMAGLDWKVEKQAIYLPSGVVVEDKFATVRMDQDKALGVVGNRYTVLQNSEAFGFADALVGIKEAIYHTAGALGQGEIIWILAKLNGVIEVVKGDITEKYLLLMNRHDGYGSVVIQWTGIRVVCQNTLNIALKNGGADISVALRHTASLGLRVDEVRKALGIISAKEKIFAEAGKRLAAVQLTAEAWKDYLTKLQLAPKDGAKGTGLTRAQNVFEEISVLFEKGKGTEIPGVRGTLWGGFNAVVEYADYVRKGDGDVSNRARSLLLGSGADLKQRAWDTALQMAK